jgi:hypothetical protein
MQISLLDTPYGGVLTREKGKNTEASIRARPLALVQSKGADYQSALGGYAIERFLDRLGRPPHSDSFVSSLELRASRFGPGKLTVRKGSRSPRSGDHPLSVIGEAEQTMRAMVETNEATALSSRPLPKANPSRCVTRSIHQRFGPKPPNENVNHA